MDFLDTDFSECPEDIPYFNDYVKKDQISETLGYVKAIYIKKELGYNHRQIRELKSLNILTPYKGGMNATKGYYDINSYKKLREFVKKGGMNATKGYYDINSYKKLREFVKKYDAENAELPTPLTVFKGLEEGKKNFNF
jgi:hypothetical protein